MNDDARSAYVAGYRDKMAQAIEGFQPADIPYIGSSLAGFFGMSNPYAKAMQAGTFLANPVHQSQRFIEGATPYKSLGMNTAMAGLQGLYNPFAAVGGMARSGYGALTGRRAEQQSAANLAGMPSGERLHRQRLQAKQGQAIIPPQAQATRTTAAVKGITAANSASKQKSVAAAVNPAVDALKRGRIATASAWLIVKRAVVEQKRRNQTVEGPKAVTTELKQPVQTGQIKVPEAKRIADETK